MNKKIDNSESLRLEGTKDGYNLFIIKTEQIKLRIKNGKILNKLSKRQMDFVKDHVINKTKIK